MLRSDQAPTALVVLLLDMHVCVELDQLGAYQLYIHQHQHNFK